MPIWKMEQGRKRDVEGRAGTVEFIKNQVVPSLLPAYGRRDDHLD